MSGDVQWLYVYIMGELVYDLVFSVNAPTEYSIYNGLFGQLFDLDHGVELTDWQGTLAPGRYRWTFHSYYDGFYPSSDDRLSLVTVPEPGVVWMLGAGLVLLARRQQRAA